MTYTYGLIHRPLDYMGETDHTSILNIMLPAALDLLMKDKDFQHFHNKM